MATTRGNFIVGAATDFKVGASGSEASVGATMAPVEWEEDEETVEVEAEQHLGVLGEVTSKKRYTVRTTLAEPTLENLRIALNQAASNLVTGTLTVDEDENGEVSVVFTGPANLAGTVVRTVTLPICKVKLAGAVGYAKGAQQGIPIEVKAYQNPSTGKWFAVVDA